MNKQRWFLALVFVVTLVTYLSWALIGEPGTEQKRDKAVTAESAPARDENTAVARIQELKQVVFAAPEQVQAGQKGRAITLADLAGLGVRDQIAIYIPQEDSEYQGTVSDVNVTAAGNQVIVGHLVDQGREYRFVFTVGAKQTFGTLHTPAGRYQLETREGVGRIISTATINQGLDFSQPDYVIPERRTLPKDDG